MERRDITRSPNFCAETQLDDKTSIFNYLKNIPGKLFDVDGLLKAAFTDGYGGFPMRSIESKRLKHLEEVRLELVELQKRQHEYSQNQEQKLATAAADWD